MARWIKNFIKEYNQRTAEIEAALQVQCLERDKQRQEYLIWKGIVT